MDVIKILPPLIITEKSKSTVSSNALDQTLDECQRFPGPMLELAKNFARTTFRGADKPGDRRVSKPAMNGHNGHHGNGNGYHVNGNGSANGSISEAVESLTGAR